MTAPLPQAYQTSGTSNFGESEMTIMEELLRTSTLDSEHKVSMLSVKTEEMACPLEQVLEK